MPKQPTEAPWLAVMKSRLGVHEVAGPQSNPLILSWFASIGHPEIVDDETAWCAATVGSALKECGLPTTPVNVNLLARSYLTYGVACEPKPGAIGVWPRGKSSWQGHVAVVEEVLPNGMVRVIGGNQGSVGEVSHAVYPIKTALGFRWPVAATVKDLRKSGSTEVRRGDWIQNLGTIGTFITGIIAAVRSLLAPLTDMPDFASLSDAFSWWKVTISAAIEVFNVGRENPWIAGGLFVGLGLTWIGHRLKQQRVAKAAAGVPLSAEVAKLEAA